MEKSNWEGSQRSRCHGGSPEQGVRFDQVAHSSYGNGLHRSRGHEDQGVKELVPTKGEAEDACRDQTGCRQGENDLDQGFRPRAAIGYGALFDLLWDRPEITHEQLRGKRDELRWIGQDKSSLCIRKI